MGRLLENALLGARYIYSCLNCRKLWRGDQVIHHSVPEADYLNNHLNNPWSECPECRYEVDIPRRNAWVMKYYTRG